MISFPKESQYLAEKQALWLPKVKQIKHYKNNYVESTPSSNVCQIQIY